VELVECNHGGSEWRGWNEEKEGLDGSAMCVEDPIQCVDAACIINKWALRTVWKINEWFEAGVGFDAL
jgi:hypothetical protein